MNKIILIVDDAPDNIRILKTILEANNYVIRAATSGEKALELAQKHPIPNIILLDVMMPEMDGIEVCRRLKANPATMLIPVVFVTARGEVQDETIGFDVGAVDYITKPVSPPIVLRRIATHLSLTRIEELDSLARSAIQMFGEVGHFHDTDTGEHIWRMSAYAGALAMAFGWSREQANILELAATLHDTGKIGIPDSILKAPRKLTSEEWEIMKTHSKIGYDILSMSCNPVFKLAAEIALNHHEKWDGSGYPNGLHGEEIPESGRIVAISDVFDALTMKRVYKKPWSVDDAFENIKNGAGNHFDPTLVGHFFSIQNEICEIRKKWS